MRIEESNNPKNTIKMSYKDQSYVWSLTWQKTRLCSLRQYLPCSLTWASNSHANLDNSSNAFLFCYCRCLRVLARWVWSTTSSLWSNNIYLTIPPPPKKVAIITKYYQFFCVCYIYILSGFLSLTYGLTFFLHHSDFVTLQLWQEIVK